jgi:hypothetical protein
MGDWKQRSLDRRDFRHIHGEPEEMPHKKKRPKINKAHCLHEFSKWGEKRSSYGPREFGPPTDRYWLITTHITKTRHCTICRKRDWLHTTETICQKLDENGNVIVVPRYSNTIRSW